MCVSLHLNLGSLTRSQPSLVLESESASLLSAASWHVSMLPTQNMSCPSISSKISEKLRISSLRTLKLPFPSITPSRMSHNLRRCDCNLLCSGYCAFTHKAGIHAKAILNNPSTYEILKPEDFGLTRYVSIGYVFFSQYKYSCPKRIV